MRWWVQFLIGVLIWSVALTLIAAAKQLSPEFENAGHVLTGVALLLVFLDGCVTGRYATN